MYALGLPLQPTGISCLRTNGLTGPDLRLFCRGTNIGCRRGPPLRPRRQGDEQLGSKGLLCSSGRELQC